MVPKNANARSPSEKERTLLAVPFKCYPFLISNWTPLLPHSVLSTLFWPFTLSFPFRCLSGHMSKLLCLHCTSLFHYFHVPANVAPLPSPLRLLTNDMITSSFPTTCLLFCGRLGCASSVHVDCVGFPQDLYLATRLLRLLLQAMHGQSLSTPSLPSP